MASYTIAGAILEKMGHFLSGKAHELTSPPTSSALAVLSASGSKRFKYGRETSPCISWLLGDGIALVMIS